MANQQARTIHTILWIEEEQFISMLYRQTLEAAGYKLTIEADGKKGLGMAQTDDYDLILLDLLVPTMSGDEILRILRDPRLTLKLHAKIIVFTNLEQRPSIKSTIEQQADYYLVKANVTPRQLIEFIQKLPAQR